MLKKFAKRIITFGLSFTLALGSAFGAHSLQKAQAAGGNDEDIVFSINAFNNLDYTFQTIDGDTISTKALPDKDVTLLVFGRTTCASTWLTIRNIAESSWIHDTNVSVIYIDIDDADAEVVQSSIDYYSRISEDAGPYYRGCEKITFCHDAEEKNEDARKMYHMLSGIRGCDSLAGIIIPKSVVNIDAKAFLNCNGLKSVSIPKSVINIGEKAFGYSDIYTNNGSEYVKVPDLTVCGVSGSTAEEYAKENGIKFQAISDNQLKQGITCKKKRF